MFRRSVPPAAQLSITPCLRAQPSSRSSRAGARLETTQTFLACYSRASLRAVCFRYPVRTAQMSGFPLRSRLLRLPKPRRHGYSDACLLELGGGKESELKSCPACVHQKHDIRGFPRARIGTEKKPSENRLLNSMCNARRSVD